METNTIEIVNALNDVKQAIYITGLLIWGALFGLILASGRVLKKFREVKGYQTVSFDQQKANILFNSGKIEELKTYCDSFERNFPNDINVIWYKALVYYHTKNRTKALEYFNLASKINPNYKETSMAYIQELEKENLGGGYDKSH